MAVAVGVGVSVSVDVGVGVSVDVGVGVSVGVGSAQVFNAQFTAASNNALPSSVSVSGIVSFKK